MWRSKRWTRLLGGVLVGLSTLFEAAIWVLDWLHRIDFIIAKLKEGGGAAAVIAWLLAPPPWLYPVALIAGLGLIWMDVRQSRKPRRPTLIRNAFSDTQSVKILPPSLGGNMSLRLDTVGTLTVSGSYSLDSITMILNAVPMEPSVRTSEGVTVEGARFFHHAGTTTYIFDTKKSKSHEIEIGGRTFLVSLLEVSRPNVANVGNPLEYKFGICEM